VRFAVYVLRVAFARAHWVEAFERTIVAIVWIAKRVMRARRKL